MKLTFGLQLAVARKAARLGVKEAAEICGASVRQWRDWEAGHDTAIPGEVFSRMEDLACIVPLDLRFDD